MYNVDMHDISDMLNDVVITRHVRLPLLDCLYLDYYISFIEKL